MDNPARTSCAALPKQAETFLKKLVNKDLTRIQKHTETIHGHFQKRERGKMNPEEFHREVEHLLKLIFEHIQEISNMNVAFPTLFTKDQLIILNDLMHLTVKLNLEAPRIESFSEFENGQLGGAAAILQQQWAS